MVVVRGDEVARAVRSACLVFAVLRDDAAVGAGEASVRDVGEVEVDRRRCCLGRCPVDGDLVLTQVLPLR